MIPSNKKWLFFILFIANFAYAEKPMQVGETKKVKIGSAASTVAVGKSSVLDYEILDDDSILLMAKGEGKSDLTVSDRDGELIYSSGYLVTESDLNTLNKQTKKIDPLSQVTIDKNKDDFLITGTASTDEKVIQICSMLKKNLSPDYDAENKSVKFDVENGARDYKEDPFSAKGVKCMISSSVQGKSLVNVKIKMIEVDKSIVDKLGIQWQDSLGTAGNIVVGQGFSGIKGILTALTKTSKSKILSEPNITVLPGEKANFSSGGELPVVTITDGGDPSVNFKKYGVNLAVAANLIDNERMRIFLSTELSSIDASNTYKRIDGTVMPALKTQAANTIVNIKNGDSFAIGGLTSNNIENYDQGVSFLSKIPLIGALFKTVEDNATSKEVIIIATVNLVDAKSKDSDIPVEKFNPLMSRYLNINESFGSLNAGPDLN